LPVFPPDGTVEGIPPIGVEDGEEKAAFGVEEVLEIFPNVDEGIFPKDELVEVGKFPKVFELVEDDDEFPNGSNPPLEVLDPVVGTFAVVEILPNVVFDVEDVGKFPNVELEEKFPKEFADEELLETFPYVDEGIPPIGVED
jgi:hypothetical protein